MSQDIVDLGMRVDTRGMVQGRREAERFGDAVQKTGTKTATAVASIRKNWLLVGAAVTAAAGALRSLSTAIRVISDFDTSMSAVAAVTRATTDELKAMRDIAKELGSTTEFTAAQAADGLKFLGMAGFEANDAIAALPDTLDLATASGMGLARAADIASNVMSAFAVQASNAARVTDALAAVASRANTSVEQVGDAMAYVGPVARAAGISVEDAAAAIGVLSDNGIQGSMAGTGLRRVISGLLNPTSEAASVIQGLGLSLAEVNPTTNDLTEIINRLGEAGMSAAEAFTIFGDRGGPAILALVNSRQRLQDLTGEMQNVRGEGKRMADTMRDNLGGDIKGLQSAVEGLMLAMGEAGLTAILRATVQGVTGLARGITQLVNIVVSIAGSIREATEGWFGFLRAIVFVDDAIRGFFRDAVAGLQMVGKATVWAADLMVDTWAGGIQVLQDAFAALGTAIQRIFAGAFNAVNTRFTGFINGIIGGLNRLPGVAIEAFEGMQLEVPEAAGFNAIESFKAGAESADLAGWVGDTIDKAMGVDRQAGNRTAANSYLDFLNNRAAGNMAGTGGTESEVAVQGGGGGGGGGGAAEAVNEALQDAQRLFEATRTDAELYAVELAKVNDLLAQGYIDQDTYNRAVRNLQEEFQGAGQAAEFFQQKAMSISDSLVDLAFQGGSLIDTFRNLASQIAKAAFQAALFGSGPMSGLFGGGAGIFSGFFANGTNNAPGGMAVVGERGPELVNLPKGSQVIPNDRMSSALSRATQQPTQMTVSPKIVNVLDPNLVGEYLTTPEGEQVIMNVVSRNKGGM